MRKYIFSTLIYEVVTISFYFWIEHLEFIEFGVLKIKPKRVNKIERIGTYFVHARTICDSVYTTRTRSAFLALAEFHTERHHVLE